MRPCEVLDKAALVPANGALFGVNLDMEARTLAEYSFNLGHTPAVTVESTGFPSNDEEKEDLQRPAVVALTANEAYASYYPGDDAVDWVEVFLYNWGLAFPWGENELPEATKFASQLTGNYLGANGDDTPVPDFYEVYGVQHGKPVAIPETAALFNPAAGGETELAIKQAWWGQLFHPATPARFP